MAKPKDDSVPVVEFAAAEDDDDAAGREDDSLEVVAGDPDEKPPAPAGKTYEQLVAEVQAEKSRADALAARVDPVAALQATLKETLGQREAAPPPQPPPLPGESDVDYAKRMKETFFEDPAGNLDSHLDRWSQRKLAPIVSQLAAMTQAALRGQAATDPDLGGTYKRYQAEVDRVVSQRADRFTNPDVYREATALVAGRHINEIVAEALAKATPAPAAPAAPAPAYSERGGRPAGAAPRQVKMPEKEIAALVANGIDPRDWVRAHRK